MRRVAQVETVRGHQLEVAACRPRIGSAGGAGRSSAGAPIFVEVGAPTDEALHAVLHTIITWMMKPLTRRGVLLEEAGSTYLADNVSDSDEARTLRPLQVAAKLLKRVFDLDLEHCTNWGGTPRIIATILEPPLIEKILPPAIAGQIAAASKYRFKRVGCQVGGAGSTGMGV